MFKELLGTLLPSRGAPHGAQAGREEYELLDPRRILFSLPALCAHGPELETIAAPAGARVLHEDDWRQLEFTPDRNRQHLEAELQMIARFAAAHRKGQGWSDIYLRKEHPVSLAGRAIHITSLPQLTAAPLAVNRRTVQGGFARHDGGGWFLYGQCTEDGDVLQLGISPAAQPPSARFASAVAQLACAERLLLVDWCAEALVDAASVTTVLEWAATHAP